MSKHTAKFLLITAVLVFLSCVKYSFKGALPSDIQTIAIPLFQDRSAWVGLQETITEDLINAFVEDNSLRVLENEKEVDLLLLGTIMSVRRRQTSITQEEQVEQEQMVVTVKVECLNQNTDKPLWTGNISEFGVLSGAGDLDDRNQAVAFAVEKIVEEVLNRTVAAW